MSVSASHSPAAKLTAHEDELKIALGSDREFALWSAQLGRPEKVLHQLNLYLRPPKPAAVSLQTEDKPLLLRIRTELPAASQLSAAGNLVKSVINAPDPEAAYAEFSSSPLSAAAYVFTLKQGLTQERGYFRSIELEEQLDPRQTVSVLRGDLTVLGSSAPGKFLSERRITVCRFLGQLLNTRCCFRRSNGELWELDLSRFPNRSDCELEVETSDPEQALSEIRAIARILNVPVQAQTKTKLQRFLEANSSDC